MKGDNHITQEMLDRNLKIISANVDRWEYNAFIENSDYLDFDAFCVLYLNYYVLLEKYLAKKLPLIEYEGQIQSFKYGIIASDGSGFFQGEISTWGCQYCKLIVFPKLQFLEKEDVDRLLALDAQMLESPDNSLLAIIERTYPLVLDLDGRAGAVHLVDHTNHDLVRKLNIEIAFDESNLDKFGEGDEWYTAWQEQNCFLGEMGEKMRREFTEILGVDVQIAYWSL